MFSDISVLAHFYKKRNDYLLYVNLLLPHAKEVKHFSFTFRSQKEQTNFSTKPCLLINIHTKQTFASCSIINIP